MKAATLLDTGPLVAFLNRSDRYHGWATAHMRALPPPLISCESVLSEACFLLHSSPAGSRAVLDLVSRGLIDPSFRLADESDPVKRLMSRYASVPMSLADGCLVRMAELHAGGVVFTLDSDFRIYRKNGRQAIPLIIPPGAR